MKREVRELDDAPLAVLDSRAILSYYIILPGILYVYYILLYIMFELLDLIPGLTWYILL